MTPETHGASPTASCSAQVMVTCLFTGPSRLDRLQAVLMEMVAAVRDLTTTVTGIQSAQQPLLGPPCSHNSLHNLSLLDPERYYSETRYHRLTGGWARGATVEMSCDSLSRSWKW